jgi:hypothetical protein
MTGAMWTKKFWMDAVERAVKTAAEVAGGYIAAVAITDWTAGWASALTVIGIATGLSVVASLLSSLRGDHESASALAPSVVPAPPTTLAQPPAA